MDSISSGMALKVSLCSLWLKFFLVLACPGQEKKILMQNAECRIQNDECRMMNDE